MNRLLSRMLKKIQQMPQRRLFLNSHHRLHRSLNHRALIITHTLITTTINTDQRNNVVHNIRHRNSTQLNTRLATNNVTSSRKRASIQRVNLRRMTINTDIEHVRTNRASQRGPLLTLQRIKNRQRRPAPIQIRSHQTGQARLTITIQTEHHRRR